jgi:Zn-dependent protease
VTMTRPPGTTSAGPGAAGTGPRIAGLRIRLTGGAYLLSMLIVLTAALALPRVAPGWPVLAYLAATAVLVAGFLASLTAHELAHAAVARRYGAGTGEIRIGLAGGTSHGGQEFSTPRAAWRVAASGLAASLVLTGVAAGAAYGLAAAGAGQLAVVTSAVLAWLNAAVTTVNALPGAGLDGGRVVQAVAWRRSGDRARATLTAGRIGQFTGALLMAGGIAVLVLGNFAGIPAALIGLMMASASRAQAQGVLAITALAGLRVRDILRPGTPVQAVPSWQTVRAFIDREFADLPGQAGLGGAGAVAFPMRDLDGGPGGVITLTQLAGVPPERRDTVRLCDIGTPVRDLVTTTPGEQLSRVLSRLAVAPRTPAALHTAGHALVLDESGQPVAVLTPADFSRASQLSALHPAQPSP